MDEMTLQTQDGGAVSAESCAAGIEIGVGNAIGEWDYATLTDAQALELAHALIGMVMQRQAAG